MTEKKSMMLKNRNKIEKINVYKISHNVGIIAQFCASNDMLTKVLESKASGTTWLCLFGAKC